MKWWQKEVVYQIYPKSFYDTNHDGIGDIRGIIEKLDYLHDLGVTMIWICPVYASPQDDNGYDISDYCDVDPMYGTMEDLDELIQKGKEKGIKLIMDLVINHTSDEHEWFKKALSNDPKYKDYYIFKQGKNGDPPTNWRSIFGGSVWEKVGDNEFYLHTFSKKQPDLNYENPELRQEIYNMINFWLDKGIAGFRVDAINHIKKDQRYQDGEVDGKDGLSTCFPFLRNVEGLDVYLDMIKKNTFDLHDCMTVSETAGADYARIGELIGEHGAFSMMFDFTYTNIDIDNEDYFRKRNWSSEELKQMIFTSQEEIQKVGWSGPFMENHDQPRSINKLIKDINYHNAIGAKALGTLYFFLRGTPFIYQGQEIGMLNFNRKSIDEFDDLQARSQYNRSLEEGFTVEQAIQFLNERSRDNARVPMAWNDQLYAGFSDTQPWLANEDHYQQINVEKQIHDPLSVLNYYKQMIDLRKNHEELIEGLFKPFETDNDIIGYTRADKYLVLVNMSSTVNKVDTQQYKTVVLNNYNTFDGDMLPYQAVLLTK